MKNSLNISKKNALDAYRNADAKGREMLEHLFGADIFNGKITDRIKTLEDAFEETGRPTTPDFADVPEDLRPYFKAQYNAIVVAEAVNEGWKADYRNGDQRKYLPWFNVLSPAGVSFHAARYGYSSASAGRAARLCLKSDTLAQYVAEQFPDIHEEILTK
jgi:hypothetical protein